ncbi:hypothetical protein RMSM_02993 [Rhodopirellula maiorica SM1]|uniref:Uncharacterized protein n=1 Tax=Rhodopirellula maiorica SM1 TaxID=1265738 RepID=M5S1M3_9BACT|nr:hypothetical protein RMSM_02993 [Rhodopirellula maiorica SM1]
MRILGGGLFCLIRTSGQEELNTQPSRTILISDFTQYSERNFWKESVNAIDNADYG